MFSKISGFTNDLANKEVINYFIYTILPQMSATVLTIFLGLWGGRHSLNISRSTLNLKKCKIILSELAKNKQKYNHFIVEVSTMSENTFI